MISVPLQSCDPKSFIADEFDRTFVAALEPEELIGIAAVCVDDKHMNCE